MIDEIRGLLGKAGWVLVPIDAASKQSFGLAGVASWLRAERGWEHRVEIYQKDDTLYHLILDTHAEQGGYLVLVPFEGRSSYDIVDGKVIRPSDRPSTYGDLLSWGTIVSACPGSYRVRLSTCRPSHGMSTAEAALFLVMAQHLSWITARELVAKNNLVEVIGNMSKIEK